MAQDEDRDGAPRSERDRVGSPALTLVLSIVVASSIFTVFASFSANTDTPGFDAVLKFTNAFTIGFEALFVVAAALVVGETVWRRRAIEVPSKMELAVCALLFGYIVVSILLRRGSLPGVHSAWWVLHLLFFFALRGVWASGINIDFRVVWSVLAAAGLIHMALFSYFVIGLPDPETYGWRGNIPGFTNIRHLAYFMAPVATLLTAALLTGPKRYVLPLALALTLVLLYPGWTGGRGSFLAFLAASVLLVLFRPARKPGRIPALLIPILVALVLPLVLPQVGPWPPILDRVEQLAEQDVTLNQVSSNRVLIWSTVVEAIEKAPLFGYGPLFVTGFLADAGIDYSLTNPHNIELQILLHWGLVGFGLTLAFVAVHAKRIGRALVAGSRETILAFAVLATILIHAQIDGSMYYPFTVVLAVLAFFRLWATGPDAQAAENAE